MTHTRHFKCHYNALTRHILSSWFVVRGHHRTDDGTTATTTQQASNKDQDRRQKTEDRRQKTEDRRQKTEDTQKTLRRHSEDTRRKTPHRRQKTKDTTHNDRSERCRAVQTFVPLALTQAREKRLVWETHQWCLCRKRCYRITTAVCGVVRGLGMCSDREALLRPKRDGIVGWRC